MLSWVTGAPSTNKGGENGRKRVRERNRGGLRIAVGDGLRRTDPRHERLIPTTRCQFTRFPPVPNTGPKMKPARRNPPNHKAAQSTLMRGQARVLRARFSSSHTQGHLLQRTWCYRLLLSRVIEAGLYISFVHARAMHLRGLDSRQLEVDILPLIGTDIFDLRPASREQCGGV